MIIIKKNVDDPSTMSITINGNAEDIAQEYVALTLKLNDEYPVVLDRAQWYLNDVLELRKEVEDD